MKNKKENINIKENIQPIDYIEEMQSSYIDYALSVIASRALPDVRDGLKPVQRRILYSMNELHLNSEKPHRKSARVVGDVLGKFHPHGDTAVYQAMVRMAQNFSLRNTLVDGHGNFGSIDGDSAAAMRYTEARLTALSKEILRDIDKNIVDFSPNFDETLKEPDVLPCRFPNLLVNGTSGIAVGMATNIPSHNLRETINATLAYMNDEDISYKKLMSLLKGPDFPTGGIIVNKDDLQSIYESGKGSLKIRGKTEIENIKGGKFNVVITEIPYTLSGNVGKFIESIADLVKDKKLDEIADIRDESKNDIRIVVETKKGVDPEKLLAKLLKYTKLQDSIRVEFLALIKTNSYFGNSSLTPKRLSLKEILKHFVEFQEEIVTRKTKFDLNKSLARLEIVSGLVTSYDYIDIIIDAIRGSESDKDAKSCLMHGDTSNIAFKTKLNEKKASKFNFTEKQADAILDMRLRRLSSLQIKTLLEEKHTLENIVQNCEEILSSKDKLRDVIINDLKNISNTYGERRKTKIGNLNIQEELLIETKVKEELYVLLDQNNYIKTIDKNAFSKLSDEEISTYSKIILTDDEDKLCVFSSSSKVNQIKISDIPKSKLKDKGIPLDTIIKLEMTSTNDLAEDILLIDSYSNISDKYILMVTSKGYGKLIDSKEYEKYRSFVKATNIANDDKLLLVKSINKNDISNYSLALFTSDSFILKFELTNIPYVKKEAQGVKCITLSESSTVISCGIFTNEISYFTVETDDGFKTELNLNSFKNQGRNTKGKKTIPGRKFTSKEVHFSSTLSNNIDSNSSSIILDNDETQLKITDF